MTTGPAPKYKVEVTAATKRDLASLARRPPAGDVVHRIDAAIRDLATDPRPPGSTKLANEELWRIRVGDYRILYQVNDSERVVTVAGVGHRGEVSK